MNLGGIGSLTGVGAIADDRGTVSRTGNAGAFRHRHQPDFVVSHLRTAPGPLTAPAAGTVTRADSPL
ncbi:MAG TPA: hypothetical protein VGA78_15670, partial [Gemmatimonadales bacterium]